MMRPPSPPVIQIEPYGEGKAGYWKASQRYQNEFPSPQQHGQRHPQERMFKIGYGVFNVAKSPGNIAFPVSSILEQLPVPALRSVRKGVRS